MISLHEPKFIGNEKKYLDKCYKSAWISTSGIFISKFEKQIINYTKSKYCVALNSCTSSLHIALKVVGVKEKDEVITSTVSFVSPINAIKYNNAEPIFFDTDENLNIDQDKVIEFIKTKTFFRNGKTYNKTSRRKISALIIIHVFGNAVKFEKLFNLCKKRKIKIIEDAAESFGTFYKTGKFRNKHTGTIGDIGCFSFNGNKIITSGGGGALITNNSNYAKKANYYASQAKDDSINFVHNDIGYNYKITNLHAAIGLGQIEKLNKILEMKKNIHGYYLECFNTCKDAKILLASNNSTSNYWLNILVINKPNNKLIKKTNDI